MSSEKGLRQDVAGIGLDRPDERGGGKGLRMLRRTLLLLVLLGWVIAYSAPELKQDRIEPYDSSSYASNGALFLSLAADFSRFLQAPIDWLFAYYHQYPAVGVRRHPPLFGIVEAGVYSWTGVSVFGANLTILLFWLVFTVGVYAMAAQFWDDAVAFATTLLIVASPSFFLYMRTIWLDIPSLAFAAWAFFFYGRWLAGGRRSWSSLLATVACMTLALYTYQLPVFLFTGLALHLAAVEWGTLHKNKKVLLAALLFVVLMTPLAIFSVTMAQDNMGVAMGRVVFPTATPVADKLSPVYWLHYSRVLWSDYSLQAVGVVLWAVLAVRQRPSTAELLFGLCLVVCYVGFSWFPSKSTRYALSMAFAASPLAVLAYRRLYYLALGERTPWREVGFAGGLIAALVVQALPTRSAPGYVAHFAQPVQDVLSLKPDARIFYAGDFDAAFVFYVRQADTAQRAQVYRATVQVEDPRTVPAFVEAEGIDFIVFEDLDLPPGMEHHRDFRSAILAYLAQSEEFTPVGRYDLLFGGPGREKVRPVCVYARVACLTGTCPASSKKGLSIPSAAPAQARP